MFDGFLANVLPVVFNNKGEPCKNSNPTEPVFHPIYRPWLIRYDPEFIIGLTSDMTYTDVFKAMEDRYHVEVPQAIGYDRSVFKKIQAVLVAIETHHAD